MRPPKERLLEMLRERSFRKGEVILASGKKSDFFIDCKKTVLHSAGQLLAGEVVLDQLESMPMTQGIEALAAVPLGGCPLAGAASLLSAQRGMPLHVLYVRPERKDHGTGQRIEGAQNVSPKAKVILVEDVVTTGGSSLRAVEALRTEGFDVVSIVALVDRLEGGRENLEGAGLPFESVYTRHDFIPGS